MKRRTWDAKADAMKACSALEIQQAFTSSNNPKGNADTKRVMRALKEACL
jgi:hypothetical protein